MDENGKLRAGMEVSKSGPQLILWDENHKIRAALLFTKEDGPGLGLTDENGRVLGHLP
jgi:hypothetical protein